MFFFFFFFFKQKTAYEMRISDWSSDVRSSDLDVLRGAELHEEGADDGGEDAGAAEGQRIHHHRADVGIVDREDGGQHHGGDHGDHVGLKEVGRHAGAVADVVADVVGDDRRVAGIVLGDAGLDLADQVGADVGDLGEDAAAEARARKSTRLNSS